MEIPTANSPYFRQLIGLLIFSIVFCFLIWEAYNLDIKPLHLKGKLEIPHTISHTLSQNLDKIKNISLKYYVEGKLYADEENMKTKNASETNYNNDTNITETDNGTS